MIEDTDRLGSSLKVLIYQHREQYARHCIRKNMLISMKIYFSPISCTLSLFPLERNVLEMTGVCLKHECFLWKREYGCVFLPSQGSDAL